MSTVKRSEDGKWIISDLNEDDLVALEKNHGAVDVPVLIEEIRRLKKIQASPAPLVATPANLHDREMWPEADEFEQIGRAVMKLLDSYDQRIIGAALLPFRPIARIDRVTTWVEALIEFFLEQNARSKKGRHPPRVPE